MKDVQKIVGSQEAAAASLAPVKAGRGGGLPTPKPLGPLGGKNDQRLVGIAVSGPYVYSLISASTVTGQEATT